MNYKRNEFVDLTGSTVDIIKNLERSDRNQLPGPVDGEQFDPETVRRFTPLQVLKTVLMFQLVDTYGMKFAKASSMLDRADRELFALIDKIEASERLKPVIIAFESVRTRHGQSTAIYGGYSESVFQSISNSFDRIAEMRSLTPDLSVKPGPCCILNLTETYLHIRSTAGDLGDGFRLK